MTRRFIDHSLQTNQGEADPSLAPVGHTAGSPRPRPQELLYVIHGTPPSSSSSSFDNLSYEPDFDHIQEETDAREREAKAKAKGKTTDPDQIATIVLVEDITKEKEKELAKKPEDEVKLLTPKKSKGAPKMTKTYFPSNGRQQEEREHHHPQLQGFYTSSSHVSFKPSSTPYDQQRQMPVYYPTSSVETVYSSSFSPSSPPPSGHCLRCCCPSEYDDDPGGATLFRVVIIASCLCLLHAAGLAVAVYILADRLTDPDMPEKPIKHICTSAIMCPFYYLFEGLTAVSIQVVGSVCGLTINLLLLVGAHCRVAQPLLIWLFSYALAILGCLGLFGIMLTKIMNRQESENDVHWSTLLICAIPLCLALIYCFCWAIVLSLWRIFTRMDNRPFACVE